MKIPPFLFGVFFLLLAGCGSTTLTSSWRDPEYGGKAGRVLIVGVAQNDVVGRMLEEEFALRLQERGMQAVPSYTLFSLDELKNQKEKVDAEIRSRGMDKVLIARMADKQVEEIAQPIYASGTSGPWWHGYYAPSSDLMAQPRTTYWNIIAVFESSLHDIASGKPVWSATLETEMGNTIDATIKSFVEVVMKDLEKGGLI